MGGPGTRVGRLPLKKCGSENRVGGVGTGTLKEDRCGRKVVTRVVCTGRDPSEGPSGWVVEVGGGRVDEWCSRTRVVCRDDDRPLL